VIAAAWALRNRPFTKGISVGRTPAKLRHS
jgi:hypothetical protein